MTTNLFRDTRGLTLLELLVTVAVIAVVAAIAVPVVTNVVSNTSDRAAEQQSADIAKFTSKYSKAGTWTYDPATQTFTGYVDSDGDGEVDADEKVEQLTVDSTRYVLDRTDGGDGSAPAADSTEASYDAVPDDAFTATGTSNSSGGSTSTSTSTIQAFIDENNDAGEAVGYDDSAQTFTGYVDSNENGVIDSGEEAATLVIDPASETVYIDGTDPNFDITPEYGVGLDPNQFTTDPVEEEANLTAPTQATTITSVGPGSDSSIIFLDFSEETESSTEADYENYRVQIKAAAGDDYSYNSIDWNGATILSTDANQSNPYVQVTGLVTSQNYFLRANISNSEGVGPVSETMQLVYNSGSWDIYYESQLTAPTNVSVNQIRGDAANCSLEPECTNNTALRVYLNPSDYTAHDPNIAEYTSYSVTTGTTSGSGSFTASDFTGAFGENIPLFYQYPGDIYLTGLDTTKRYFFRFSLANSVGESDYTETIGIYYDPNAPEIIGGPQWMYQTLDDVSNNMVNGTG